MKKILIVNDHVHFGGGGDAVLQLEYNALIKNGYDVSLLGFGDSTLSQDSLYLIDMPSNVKMSKFLLHKKIRDRFTEVVNKIEPDIIHLHLISKFPVSLYTSSALKNVKVIQTLHGPNLFCASSWGGLKNSGGCDLGIGFKCATRGCVSSVTSTMYVALKNKYWRSLKENVDVFHCPSHNILNSAKRLGLGNSIYIPLGIDDVFNQVPQENKSQRFTLLYVGAIEIQKGVGFLLPALIKIKEKFPDVLLRIAGRGSMLESLKIEAQNLGLEDNIEFLGFVDHSKIREFYLSGHIFLMPSIWQEQFGLVGPEALACKVPCIASNVGGIPEWLRHDENGVLVPPQDSNGIADAVLNLLSNPDKMKEMGEKGRDFVLNYYSGKKYIDNLFKLFSE